MHCDRMTGRCRMGLRGPDAGAPTAGPAVCRPVLPTAASTAFLALSLLTGQVFVPTAAAGQAAAAALSCPALDPRGPAADPDLYCIELIHAPDFPDASGYVELTPPPSPFGAAVTADGHHRFDLSVHLAGLPDPSALGDYAGYVAWAATPRLRPIVNLGPVVNGRTVVGPVDLDKFLVIVTAESDPERSRPGRGVSCCAAPRPACAWSRRTCWR